MVKCKLCGKKFNVITNTHLLYEHGWKISSYIKKFGPQGCGFISPNILPKSDPRFKKWKKSLEKRPPSWCTGYTKETHPSVAKISKTFKRKKIDNFADWRLRMAKEGKLPSYPDLEKAGELAELIGVVLGDGNICKFLRTESLEIAGNSNNKGFIRRYGRIVEKVFSKKPTITKLPTNCIKIRIYQKNISKRLNIPAGARGKIDFSIPSWILNNKKFLISYLRGLYEAEGSFCIHKPTYTYKFLFGNKNESLLNNVFRGMKILGFHPHRSGYQVQISKKKEVYNAKKLLRFRSY